ncbi:MAG: D-glycero-beta-D-manno-heptose 1-phosphate adenylyltransferase [Bacteroidales bacterium]
MQKAEIINAKIYQNPKKLTEVVDQWKKEDERIIFTNGCFDILHFGHIHYLCRAADMGDKLVIGLNTDRSVKKLKGKGRPINEQNARASVLASLFFVDAVCFFDADTPIELIKTVKPDVLVKGGDYKAEDIVGFDIVKASGGEVVCLKFIEGYSSSNIINKLDSNK